jgi:bifunctional ADP-heptose synthase (sugar kinase/adenylyltransferase)
MGGSVSKAKICILGDIAWGEKVSVSELSDDCFKVNSQHTFLHLSGTIAEILKARGHQVCVASVLGETGDTDQKIRSSLQEKGIDFVFTHDDSRRALVYRKIDNLDGGIQFWDGTTSDISETMADEFYHSALSVIRESEVVVLLDYGMGSLPIDLTKLIISECHSSNRPVVVMPCPGTSAESLTGASVVMCSKKDAPTVFQDYREGIPLFLSVYGIEKAIFWSVPDSISIHSKDIEAQLGPVCKDQREIMCNVIEASAFKLEQSPFIIHCARGN